VRVIAGAAKGRRLAAPAGRATRPTSDRVREALFSALQARLPGARVADLYAGSGALGIEALSRGAASATFVERAGPARRALADNLRRTGLAGAATVVPGDVRAALAAGLPGAPFDLALLDPPYQVDPGELADVLARLVDHLRPGATAVVERGRRSPPVPWPRRLLPVRERRYGDTVLVEATLATPPGPSSAA
jgi:16S rRNA (guanine966-N2)-methyltransferase